jgi:DNA-binding winged helix-turn-helix (wHTH) protein
MLLFGPFCVDAARRVLTREDRPVPVTARAFDVLLALLERAGQTVDKEELLRAVWPDTMVEEANLSQQIFTLRKLLGQTVEEAYITTVPRRGYRFVAPVTQRGAPAAKPSAVGVARPRPSTPVRLEITFDRGVPIADAPATVVAISRDGSRVVYVGFDGTTTRLYLRPLDQFESTAIAGTDGATNPFFSPDGQWIAFQSGRRLQKIPLEGGASFTLADVADLRGAAWSSSGIIVYAPGPTTGLWRVPASGGLAAALTTLDFDGGERTHRWPHALPDGGIIFTIGTAGAASFDEATLAMTHVEAGGHRIVLRHATDGRYVADGRLVWARGASVFAAAFDAPNGRIEGNAQVVQQGVSMSATGAAHFACSDNGVLVHVPGEAQSLRRSLVSVNRAGIETARHTTGDSLEEPRFSLDGRSAIVSLRSRSSDLWLYDFARGALGRLTFEGENFAAIWGPGEGTITYSSSPSTSLAASGPSDLYLLQPDRSAPPELLVASEFDKVAGAWSGSMLVFTEYHPETGADIWLLDRAAEQVRPFIRTRFNEYAPVFSPDGRYIAYVTDESGRPEIVVVSYPDATGKRLLSTEGGTEPVWSRDGSELFYRSGERLMRVDMSRSVAHAGIPTTLFEGRFVPGTVTLPNYDVSADGMQFLMVTAHIPPPPSALRVTVG